MLLKIFRALSLPFFEIYSFFYITKFGIRPFGKGIFSLERKPRKYRGKDLQLSDGTKIKKGDLVLFLHLKSRGIELLRKNGRAPKKSEIRNILNLSFKELAEISRKNSQQFNAFCGRTSIYLPLLKEYGFEIIPLNSKIRDLEASLQYLFLRNKFRFRKRKFYLYLISRKSIENFIPKPTAN